MAKAIHNSVFMSRGESGRLPPDGAGLRDRARLRECGLLMLGAVWLAAQAAVAQQATPKAGQQNQPSASEFVGSEVCATCHGDVARDLAAGPHAEAAQTRGPKGVACESCHGAGKAHVDGSGDATKIVKPAKGVQNTTCTKCHAEMEGPFVYEHPVVKTEGCVSCHAAHGSENPRLLKESNIDTLCRGCHSVANSTAQNAHALSPGGTARNEPARDTACTTCHAQIHGSNASNVFFK